VTGDAGCGCSYTRRQAEAGSHLPSQALSFGPSASPCACKSLAKLIWAHHNSCWPQMTGDTACGCSNTRRQAEAGSHLPSQALSFGPSASPSGACKSLAKLI